MQASHQAGSQTVLKSQLIRGDQMRCPHCEQFNHLFWYVRYEQVEKYAMETNPVYMCPKFKGGCGHVFSPGDHSLLLSVLNNQTDNTNGHSEANGEAVSELA